MNRCWPRVLLVSACVWASARATRAQLVSDSDFLWIDPAAVALYQGVDTTFQLSVMCETRTPLGEISLPLTFSPMVFFPPGDPDLSIDTTVMTPPDLYGVTYGPLGRDPAWTLRTVTSDDSAKTIVLGFLSFSVFAPHTWDTLCTVHFDLKATYEAFQVIFDTITLGSVHPSIVDTSLNEQRPTWTAGYFTNFWDQVREQPVLPGVPGGLLATPNPFNAATRLEFELASPGHVRMEIVNTLGRRVATVLDASLPGGRHEVVWDGRTHSGEPAASGVYFAVLRDGRGAQRSRALTLLK